MVENVDEFDENPAIHQYFPYQNFNLVTYFNLWPGAFWKSQYPKHTKLLSYKTKNMPRYNWDSSS